MVSLFVINVWIVFIHLIEVYSHFSPFKFQCISLSDRQPQLGTDLVLEVDPEPETNSDLTDSCGVRPPETPHGVINKYARTHTTCSWWALTRSFESRLLSLSPYSCLTCLTASFVISNHLLFERLWQTGVLAASVWCWELGFSAE